MAAGRAERERPPSDERDGRLDGRTSDAADGEPDDDVRVPTLREELRTAAEYGMVGRWAQRRRDKIRAEVARNRAGGHKVPTWVLAVVLVVFVVGWVLLIVLS